MRYSQEEIDDRKARGVWATAFDAPISLEQANAAMAGSGSLGSVLRDSVAREALFQFHTKLCLSWAAQFNVVVGEMRRKQGIPIKE